MTLDTATGAEVEVSNAAVSSAAAETVDFDLLATQPIDISALLRQQA